MFALTASIRECSPLLAMSTPAMLYVVCLIVGGGLLVISTFLGGDADVDADGDFDFDADADAELGVEGHVHAGDATEAAGLSLTDWFSMRFVVYFAAAFGLIGTVLTFSSQLGSAGVFASSVIGGVVMGQVAHQVLRALHRSSGNTQVTRSDYVNKRARVTIAIEPPRRGEVALHVRGRERFIPSAAKRGDDRFAVGDSVAIVALHSGTAEVISLREHEFVTESMLGGNDEHDTDIAS